MSYHRMLLVNKRAPLYSVLQKRDSCFRRNGGVFSPEWRILIKRLKVPPFRRKPESL
ncbi:MAG: hypothetical protein ACR2QC_04850 [Gammaproteobacteria bacterium]